MNALILQGNLMLSRAKDVRPGEGARLGVVKADAFTHFYGDADTITSATHIFEAALRKEAGELSVAEERIVIHRLGELKHGLVNAWIHSWYRHRRQRNKDPKKQKRVSGGVVAQ